MATGCVIYRSTYAPTHANQKLVKDPIEENNQWRYDVPFPHPRFFEGTGHVNPRTLAFALGDPYVAGSSILTVTDSSIGDT